MAASSPVSIKLTQVEKKRLAKVAKRTKRSAHFVLREAVTLYLDKVEARLDFIREAEDAWREYKDQGVSFAHDDVEAWFNSDRTKPAPWQK